MLKLYFIISSIILLGSCTTKVEKSNLSNHLPPIVGTWKLLTGTTIEGKETTITNYTKNQELIKIINKSHFAFLRHDLKNGKDSSAIFVSGGGKYSLNGNKYIEHLEYCNYREWENNSFEFEFEITGDTLVTKGVEKVENLKINRINIEKYIRVKE